MADHKINSKLEDFFIIKSLSGSSTNAPANGMAGANIKFTAPSGYKPMGIVSVTNGGKTELLLGRFVFTDSEINIWWYNRTGYSFSFIPSATILFMKIT